MCNYLDKLIARNSNTLKEIFSACGLPMTKILVTPALSARTNVSVHLQSVHRGLHVQSYEFSPLLIHSGLRPSYAAISYLIAQMDNYFVATYASQYVRHPKSIALAHNMRRELSEVVGTTPIVHSIAFSRDYFGKQAQDACVSIASYVPIADVTDAVRKQLAVYILDLKK